MLNFDPSKIRTLSAVVAAFGLIVFFLSKSLIERNLITNNDLNLFFGFIFITLICLVGLWIWNNIAEKEIKRESNSQKGIDKFKHQVQTSAFSPVLSGSPNSTINVITNLPSSSEISKDRNPVKKEYSTDELRSLIKILFIDDEKTFKIISIIKNNGWKNTSLIADVENLDAPNIRETNIFFVDIQGIGKKLGLPNEGLDLAFALKEKYPHKKLVIYSTWSSILHPALNKADVVLPKNSPSIEYLTIIEKLSKEVYGK
jgi:hypothetical protein